MGHHGLRCNESACGGMPGTSLYCMGQLGWDSTAWECAERTLGAEELARDVEGLAADDDNLLAVQKLLGHGRGKTAEQMALAINDNL